MKKEFYWAAAVLALFILAFIFIFDSLFTIKLPQEGEPPLFYSTEKDGSLIPLFASAIDSAKKSVHLSVYNLTEGSLIAKMRDKVEKCLVSAIYDRKASPKTERRLGKRIESFPFDGPGLMHRKVLIVDDGLVLLGSANLTEASLRMHGNLVLAFHHKKMAKTLKYFALPGKFPKKAPFLFDLSGQKTELWLLPEMGPKAAERILSLIEGAKKTIRIAMFTWTRSDFAQAVVRSKLRGVDVETAIDRNSAKGAGRLVFKTLQKGGIPLYTRKGGGLLHHKFLYIDGKTLVNGSANWTKAAFTQNRDCFIVLHDLTEQQQKEMDGLWDLIIENSASH